MIHKLLYIHDNQFGFKTNDSTETCVFSLKHMTNDYKK